MAAVEFGTNIEVGVAAADLPLTLPNATTYYIESFTEDGDVDMEVTNDADGAPAHIAVYGKYPKVTLTLICKNTAAPTTDFPVGTMIDTNWYVESAPVTKTKSPHRVQLSLVKIFG